ncbi:MAG TPA: hypothetical protein VGJ15_01155 [Pirellulales bacterium]|jgi:hypothetical protein
MSIETENELLNFYAFIGQQIELKQGNMSPEDALDRWRDDHPVEEEDEDTIEALKEAIADYEAGDRGIPLEQFQKEFRRRHNLGGDS